MKVKNVRQSANIWGGDVLPKFYIHTSNPSAQTGRSFLEQGIKFANIRSEVPVNPLGVTEIKQSENSAHVCILMSRNEIMNR